MKKNISRAWALFSVYFIAAIDNCGYAIAFVLFPPLLLNPEYGFLSHDPSLASKLIAMGVLYSAFPLAQLLGAPILGELADFWGRKKAFYVSIYGTIGAYLLSGYVLSLKSIFLLFIARFLTGLFAGNQSICNASIADLSPNPKQRAKNFGVLTVVWGLSFPIGLAFGGLLSNPSKSALYSPSLPFYLIAAITLLSLLTLALFFPETFQANEKKERLHFIQGIQNILDALKIPSAKRFFMLMFVWTLGWGYSVTWYGAYAMQKFDKSQEIVTFGLMIQGIGWTFGGAFIKPLLLRFMQVWTIAKFSYVVTTILLIITSCMPSYDLFIVMFALSAVMGAISLSSTFNIISIATPKNIQGKAMGITQSMMALGFFLVPILGGIIGAISIDTFFPISAFFLFIGLMILLRSKKPCGS